jgi:glycosyltransferase involved in cell wall biosynthesis
VWGSDLVRFSTDDDHRGEIVEVLNSCGFLYCDCKRDVALATDLGFRGEVLGVVPGGGGYDLAAMAGLRSPDKATLRKTIAVKGYEHAAGRALAAVKALESVAESLAGYRVVFHSTHPIVNEEVERLKATAPFEVDVLPRGPIEDVWRLFGRARLALGLSRFDGVPNTMLEAMIMGALPIQTDPGGASREWIQDGVNGLLVPWDDVGAVADALRRGVTDDGLVDGADEMNTVIAQNRLSSTTIKRTVIENYARVVSGGP